MSSKFFVTHSKNNLRNLPTSPLTGRFVGPIVLTLAFTMSPFHVATASSDDSQCIPDSEVAVRNVNLGMSNSTVTSNLGSPLDSRVGFGEDDGGSYQESVLVYNGLEIYIVRSKVDRVVVTSPRICTHNGICAGKSRSDVKSILGERAPVAESGDGEQQFALCGENGQFSDTYLIIRYGLNETVESIELVQDRP